MGSSDLMGFLVWAGCVWRKPQPTASGSTVLRVMRNIQRNKAHVLGAFHGIATPPMAISSITCETRLKHIESAKKKTSRT